MFEALVLLGGAACWLASRHLDQRRFARHLSAAACPWCRGVYGRDAARRSMRGQSFHARAFAVGCGRCGRVQLLVPRVT